MRTRTRVVHREWTGSDAGQLDFFWSVSTGVAGQAALLISGPVVAQLLGVERRGYLALFILLPALVMQVAHLGLPDAVPYHLAGDLGRLAGLKRAIQRPVLMQMVLATCTGGLVMSSLVKGRAIEVQLAGFLSLPLIPLSLAQSYGLAILQGLQRFARFQLFRLVPVALYAAGTLILLLAQVHSLVIVMLTWVASQLVGTTLLAIALPRVSLASDASNRPATKTLLYFGMRGWLGSATPMETFRLDQAVVGLLLSPGALGLYVVGVAFANLPRFIGQSMGMVAYPRIAADPDPVSAIRSLKRYLFVAVGICGTVTALLGAVCPLMLPTLFGDEFAAAVPATRLLLLAAVLLSVRRVLGDGLRGLGRPGATAVAELAAAFSLVAGLTALAVFLPPLQLEGVATAVAISAASGLLVTLAQLRRVERAVTRARTSSMEDI